MALIAVQDATIFLCFWACHSDNVAKQSEQLLVRPRSSKYHRAIIPPLGPQRHQQDWKEKLRVLDYPSFKAGFGESNRKIFRSRQASHWHARETQRWEQRMGWSWHGSRRQDKQRQRQRPPDRNKGHRWTRTAATEMKLMRRGKYQERFKAAAAQQKWKGKQEGRQQHRQRLGKRWQGRKQKQETTSEARREKRAHRQPQQRWETKVRDKKAARAAIMEKAKI